MPWRILGEPKNTKSIRYEWWAYVKKNFRKWVLIMKYLVKTLSAWTTFEDLILNESELKEYKEYAREQQLLLEVTDYE